VIHRWWTIHDEAAMMANGGNEPTYLRLRRMVLDLDPAGAGMIRTPDLPRVWGALMDTGYPDGTATIVCLADGTTSLYTSNGGGILGAGRHEIVALATRRLLKVVEAHVDLMAVAADGDALPGPDQVVMRALTFAGQYAAPAEEDDLAYHRHPLAAMFHAFHEVITQLRLLDDTRES
jgi:hypothetical protein